MSWEEMSRDEMPCRCGKGKIVKILRIDDWNRTETIFEILCDECRNEEQERSNAEERKSAERRKCRAKAVSLARARYLKDWLEAFDGMSKKRIWEAMPKSKSGYPSLRTFYAHVKHFGSIPKYLEWRFESDIEELFLARFEDHEIEDLLQKASERRTTR